MKSASKRIEKRGSVGALNIRDVPDRLLWACSAQANLNQQKLREFVIRVLDEATKQAQQMMS